jgi:hypothetical protein
MEQILPSRCQRGGERPESLGEPACPVAGEVAATVRGGNEHYALHKRQRLKKQPPADFSSLRLIDLLILQAVGALGVEPPDFRVSAAPNSATDCARGLPLP